MREVERDSLLYGFTHFLNQLYPYGELINLNLRSVRAPAQNFPFFIAKLRIFMLVMLDMCNLAVCLLQLPGYSPNLSFQFCRVCLQAHSLSTCLAQ